MLHMGISGAANVREPWRENQGGRLLEAWVPIWYASIVMRGECKLLFGTETH